MTKKKRVTFMATKRVPKKIPVSFKSGGKRVSFHATKRVPKKVRVEFYAKSKKRK
jgi:uncharacterized protein YxeA